MLTAETLRRVLNYNPDTGLLTWRESRGRVAAGQVAGSLRKRDGVVRVRVNGRFYGAHRLAWLWVKRARLDWQARCIENQCFYRSDK